MVDRRNRTTLILLIVMALIIISSYYSGHGVKIINGAQRATINVLSPVYKAANAIVSPIGHGWNYLLSFNRLNGDNYQLSKTNSRLKSRLQKLTDLKKENQRLRKLVGFKNETKLRMVPAKVIGRAPDNWQSTIIINRGKSSGIKKYQPVVTDTGLVGQVVESGNSIARIMLLNDRKSAVSVEVKRTGKIGVAEGKFSGGLKLKYMPKDADIKLGDQLVTSGVGQVYPRNLLIGTIKKINNNQYGMEKIADIKEAVDFQKLEEVLVIIKRPASAISVTRGDNN